MKSLRKNFSLSIMLFVGGIILAGTPTLLASSAKDDALIFYLSFEDSIDAAKAEGNKKGESEGEMSFVKGYQGKGIRLIPGASLRYENRDNFNVETGTIMFWFYPEWERNGEGRYWFFQNTILDFYRVRIEAGRGWLQFRIRDDIEGGKGYVINKAIPDISKGKWHHIAFTWDENEGVVIYLNGEEVAKVEKTWQGYLREGNKNFTIYSQKGKGEEAGKSGIIDEFKIFNRALSKDEVKYIFMAVETLVEKSEHKQKRQQTKPLFSAQFENNTQAIFMGRQIKGNISGRANYEQGVTGSGVVIKRYAYDQKASLLYKNLSLLAEKTSISFFFKPYWDADDKKRYEIINFISGSKEVNLIKGKDNRLLLRFRKGNSIDEASTLCKFKKNNLYKIFIKWNLAQKKYILYVDGEEVNKGVFKNIGKTFFAGNWDMWVGSRISSIYKGDAGDGLFDKLEIYSQDFSPQDLDPSIIADIKERKEGAATAGLEVVKIQKYHSDLQGVWSKKFTYPEISNALILYYPGKLHTGMPFSYGKLEKGRFACMRAKKKQDGTISFWAKLNKGRENKFTFMEILTETFKYQFVYDPSIKKVNLLISGEGKAKSLNSLYKINTEEWNYYSITWDKDMLYFYINATYQSYLRDPINHLEDVKEVRYSKDTSSICELYIWEQEAEKRQLIDLFNIGMGKVVFKEEPLTEYEKKIWSLSDAEKERSATREKICLNGIWRFCPSDGNNFLPAPDKEMYYGRIPGNWRSMAYYTIYDKTHKPVKQIKNKSLEEIFHGSYTRYIEIPESFSNQKIYLTTKYIGANAAMIYVDNKLVQTFAQRNKNAQGEIRYIYADLTEFNKHNIKVDIFLYFNKETNADAVSLLDVYLEKYNPIFTKDTIIRTSVKDNSVSIRTTLVNTDKDTGNRTITANIYNNEKKLIKTSSGHKIDLTGDSEQNLDFNFKWDNPVLWTHFNPVLYNLKLVIKSNKGAVIDESYNHRFGFREFEVKNGDFYLNSKKVHLFYESSAGVSIFLRYSSLYGAKKEFAFNAIRALKENGYNTIRVRTKWSWSSNRRKTSHFQENILNAADELGFFIIFGAPPLGEFMDIELYKECVDNYVKVWGNHPSIILYLVTFNACGYSWAIQPSKVDDLDYIPKHKIKERKLALLSDKIIKVYDPTRETYHNYSGNLTNIYTTMHYMSLGLPLQEREDWPSKWSKTKKTAFVPTEVGFPYAGQFIDFDAPSSRQGGELLFVEHAARYFGDSIYREVVEQAGIVRRCNYKFFYEGDKLKPVFLKIKSLFAKNQIRAWRCYDVSGIGMFGEEGCSYARNFKGFKMDVKYDNLKIKGAKPDRMLIHHRYHYLDKPTAYFYKLQEYLSPIMVTIGGREDDFNEKDHAYFAGSKIEKQAIIINDTMDEMLVKMQIVFSEITGKKINEITRDVIVNPGHIYKEPFEFLAPAVSARKDYNITLKAMAKGKVIGEDRLKIEVFPHEKFDKKLETIGLFDKKGLTEELLKKIGVSYKRIKSFSDIRDIRTLIIGRETLSRAKESILEKIEQNKLIEKGLNIIMFEQKECNFANLIYEATSQRYVFIKNGGHPVLAGLKDEDFINWRGSTDLIEAYSVPDPESELSPHYPHAKWKWGNEGIVSTFVIRKPQFGNFNIILDCGFDLMNSPLLELTKGKGNVLICQLDVTERYGFDPVATKVVNNILTYSALMKSKPEIKTAYYGSSNIFLQMLQDSHAIAKRLLKISNLNEYKLLILSPENFKELYLHKNEISEFVKRGGTVLYLHNKGNNDFFKWLPFDIKLEKKKIYNAFVAEEGNKLIRGLGNCDFYWRTPKEVCIFSGTGVKEIVTPGVIALRRYGDGTYIFCGINPDNFQPKPFIDKKDRKYISFIKKEVHQKSIRIITTLLNNLGVQFDAISLFGNSRYMNNYKSDSDITIKLNEWKFRIDPDDTGMKDNWYTTDFNDTAWEEITVPKKWEEQGYTMGNPKHKYEAKEYGRSGTRYSPYDGYAWYRTKIYIPKSCKGGSFKLTIGVIDDYDWTYFNGREIGKTGNETIRWWEHKREYPIPENLIEFDKDNYIAIRVFDIHGSGGITKGPVQLEIRKKDLSGMDYSAYVKDLPRYDVNAFHLW